LGSNILMSETLLGQCVHSTKTINWYYIFWQIVIPIVCCVFCVNLGLKSNIIKHLRSHNKGNSGTKISIYVIKTPLRMTISSNSNPCVKIVQFNIFQQSSNLSAKFKSWAQSMHPCCLSCTTCLYISMLGIKRLLRQNIIG